MSILVVNENRCGNCGRWGEEIALIQCKACGEMSCIACVSEAHECWYCGSKSGVVAGGDDEGLTDEVVTA